MQKLSKMADSNEGDEIEEKNQIKLEGSENGRVVMDINNHELCMPLSSEPNRRVEYLEEADVLEMAQIPENSLASPENGCSLESCTFLDTAGGSAQWWDF